MEEGTPQEQEQTTSESTQQAPEPEQEPTPEPVKDKTKGKEKKKMAASKRKAASKPKAAKKATTGAPRGRKPIEGTLQVNDKFKGKFNEGSQRGQVAKVMRSGMSVDKFTAACQKIGVERSVALGILNKLVTMNYVKVKA